MPSSAGKKQRYVESLSAYARQFLDQMEKPDVDFIEGLSPAIAIEQSSAGTNPRTIIASTAEMYDYVCVRLACSVTSSVEWLWKRMVVLRHVERASGSDSLVKDGSARVLPNDCLIEGYSTGFVDAYCFFSCDDDPRDLHSFPTRRSSD